MTTKQYILETLADSVVPLACHEFKTTKWSQNNIATRLSELAKDNKIIGAFRKGKNFKEWFVKR